MSPTLLEIPAVQLSEKVEQLTQDEVGFKLFYSMKQLFLNVIHLSGYITTITTTTTTTSTATTATTTTTTATTTTTTTTTIVFYGLKKAGATLTLWQV